MLRRLFTLDLRALALLRIAMGALLLADLAIRLPDLFIHYTSAGAFSVRYLAAMHPTSKHFGLYIWFDQPWAAALFFLLAALSATALLLGYRTRLATVVSWYLLVCLHYRNHFLLDMGDVYLRQILLWSIFLPMGARWSLDAKANEEWRQLPNAYFSPATVGYVVQVCLLYFCAAAQKNDPLWTRQGDALYLALSIDQFSTGFGQSLLAYPTLLRLLNFVALAVEWSAAFLILSRFRLVGLVLLTAFHLGIASCMHFGLLVPICIAMLLGLLPGHVMERLQWQWPISRPLGPRRPEPSGYRLHVLTKAFLGSLILYLFVQNALTVPQLKIPTDERVIVPVANYGRIFAALQNWRLFAPYPFRDDGWFIVEGSLADGRQIDLLRGGQPLSMYKPEQVSAQFANQRWRRFYQNLWLRANPRHIPFYCKWELERWNRAHPEKLTRVRLLFVQEWSELPGKAPELKTYIAGEYPSADLPEGEDHFNPQCHDETQHLR